MISRNRLFPLLCRCLLLGWLLASLVEFVLAAGPSYAGFCLLSVQAGAFFAMLLFFAIISNAIDLRHGIRGIPAGMYMPLALPVMAYGCFGSLTYLIFNLGSDKSAWLGIFFHVSLLLIILIDYLLFEQKGNVRLYSAVFSEGYVLIYLLFVYIRPYIWNNSVLLDNTDYPYFFMVPDSCLCILYDACFLACSLIFLLAFVLLDGLLSSFGKEKA